MQNIEITDFWKIPQEVRIELFNIDDRKIGDKITKLHEFEEKENFVTIKDYIKYEVESDFGRRVIVNKVKLYYENELIKMCRFPNITMDLGDNLFITFTLKISVIDNGYKIEVIL